MPTQRLSTSKTHLEVRADSTFTGLNMAADNYGGMGFDVPEAHSIQVNQNYSPYSTHQYTGKDEIRSISGSFNYNALTHDLFVELEGVTQSVFYVRKGYNGNTSGQPYIQYSFVITNYNVVADGNIYRIELSGSLDGEVTSGTY